MAQRGAFQDRMIEGWARLQIVGALRKGYTTVRSISRYIGLSHTATGRYIRYLGGLDSLKEEADRDEEYAT